MRLNRFIIDSNLKPGNFKLTDPEITRQISKVLRLKKGEEIVLCDGRGHEALAKISDLAKNSLDLEVAEPHQDNGVSTKHVTLYCSILKRENFDWVIQKATEVGVSTVIPVVTERTVKQNLNLERLRKIAKEATEQSGRCYLPEIKQSMTWPEALAHAKNNDVNFFMSSRASVEGSGSSRILRSSDSLRMTNVGVFIGPEGGWTNQEIKDAESHGCVIASLGKTTLRAETAAVVASFLTAQL